MCVLWGFNEMWFGYQAGTVSYCGVALHALPLRRQSAAVSISASKWASDTCRREGRAGEVEPLRSMVTGERERECKSCVVLINSFK